MRLNVDLPAFYRRDNRDLGVFTNWDPLNAEDLEAPAKQFIQDKNYTKLKFMLLECLVSCSNISIWAIEKTDLDLQREIKLLEDSIEAFDRFFQELEKEKYEAVNQFSVSSPLPSRILSFVNSPMPFRELYHRAFSIVILYARSDFDPLQKVVKDCVVLLEKCSKHVCDILDHQINAKDPLWTCRNTLEIIVNSIEVI
jgi:hypothetical protein